ncbi:MAG: YraN family protein [Betaproteobacteria bacterium]|jgi:putative endonuclease|nr:YraN family protein [Betaproteobacteria bacterium]MCC7217042.1 YraN family protein [Burkholderiales bacterium]
MRRAEPPAQSSAAAGARAEALAADYLGRRGLAILARNFRTRRGEIDVVARDRGTLVFVEVRLRSGSAFGGAAASITPAKRARLLAAADAYLATLDRVPPCRFDAVLLDALDPARIAWVRGVIEA